MLVSRSPYAEALSAQAILMVNELLPSVLPRARVDRRQDLVRLQTSLCHLGILDEPVIFVPKGKQAVHPPTLWQNDPTVDPTWLAWVCAPFPLNLTVNRMLGVRIRTGVRVHCGTEV
jgi:hypothetical protein